MLKPLQKMFVNDISEPVQCLDWVQQFKVLLKGDGSVHTVTELHTVG